MEVPRSVAVFSGCGWSCSGGAQRPVAMARQLRKRGFEVWYYSEVDRQACRSPEGVHVIGQQRFDPQSLPAEGLAICCLPPYFPYVQKLHERGWKVLYDLLDDWEAFIDEDHLQPDALEHESALIECSSACIASAPKLHDYLRAQGAKHVELILNGGPEEPVTPAHRVSGPGIHPVLCSHLFGEWMDWKIIEAVTHQPDLFLSIIGKYHLEQDWTGRRIDSRVDGYAPRAHFRGELPWESALKLMATQDCGIIPFKGRICHSVDPIKYYDHLACGLWTVASSDLWPMIDRKYTLIANRSDFPEAVRLAAKQRKREPVDPAEVAANAWSARVESLLAFLERVPEPALAVPAARQRESRPSPRTPSAKPSRSRAAGLAAEDCRLTASVQIPGTCQMQPQCPYCNTAALRQRQTALSASADQWADALLRLGDRHGPVYYTFCHGEPLGSDECISVLAKVAQRNHIDVVTNLLTPASRLLRLPRNGNLAFATSFHPHAWRSVDEFMRRRWEYEIGGLRMGTVGIVAYPPHFEKLEGWREQFLERGLTADAFVVIPYHGSYHGQHYPAAYTASQQSALQAYHQQSYLGELQVPMRTWERSQGLPCRTGRDFVFIEWDGTVHRCTQGGQPLGNLLQGTLKLNAGAEPCLHETCPCPDLWKYIEPGTVIYPPGESPHERALRFAAYERHRREQIRLPVEVR
jgi:hypothetical protein